METRQPASEQGNATTPDTSSIPPKDPNAKPLPERKPEESSFEGIEEPREMGGGAL